jgi:1-acyl-sn-glycerol-3-phosphate acyltransferase
MRYESRYWTRPSPTWRTLAPALSWILHRLFDLRISGLPHVPDAGPVLVVANHVGHLDPAVLLVALWQRRRRARFLAVSGLFRIPVLAWLLRRARAIPVVRGAGQERMTDDAVAALDAGQAVVVYPEGTIAPPGTVLSAKPGVGLLALRAGVPVVPMAMSGLEPRSGRRHPRLRGRVEVRCGAPVALDRWAGRRDLEAQLEVSATLLAAVRALLTEEGRALRRGVI